MYAIKDSGTSRIMEEIGRGSSLPNALDLIAEQLATDIGAPACKIWVVKRGDICDRCPLQANCANREMCMHLMAASGASLEREYPRIPLALLTAPWISRGGTADFNDPRGAGERLFGLQRSTPIRNQDCFALFPLRGTSGTVGLIGVFNHRPLRSDELETIASYAPTAVAAIRVAELQSRCESLRARLQKKPTTGSLQQANAREGELEEAVAQLTHQVAQLRVERDAMAKTTEEARRIIAGIESDKAQIQKLLDQNIQTPANDAEFRKSREETEKLKERVKSLETNIGEQNRMRENLMGELAERNLEAKQLNTRLLRMQSRLSTAEEEAAALAQRLLGIEQTHSVLEDEKATFIDSVNHLERSLQIAEDARARYEQASVVLEERVANLNRELERMKVENARVIGENEQLVVESDRLAHERDDERKKAAELTEANTALEAAAEEMQSLARRLEDSALKLQRKVEASDSARAELEQRVQVLTQQNRRLGAEGQSRARFLASMSHELRTPMNAIIGFTSLLLDDPGLELSDRHRVSLERVARNGRDLLELINNVLDLSKIEAGRMDVYSEPADLRMLIDRAVNVSEPAKDGRQLKLVVDANGLPALRTDRTKLQQVLINLLSNALKFTQEGEVKVSAAQVSPDEVRISVSDTGIGIAESDLPRIFEEFRQAGAAGRGERKGTGLGLAITKKLVELIGGRIDVSSHLGQGSTFAVTIPVEIEGRAAPESDLEAPLVDPERTALIIDSDPGSLFITKKYLGEAGYSVAATDDPTRAVEIAKIGKPSVIILDLDSMERGLDLVEQIGKVEKGRILIAMSSDSSTSNAVIEKGASIFMRKPIERSQLIGLVTKRDHAQTNSSVLVVDDDPDARDLVVAMIGDRGFQIRTAANGREALELIAHSRPDAIILDLMLPEMDGFEVIHRMSLNPQWRSIPVILVTARDLSHEERRALDISSARLIPKGTFTRDELLAELGVAMSGEVNAGVVPAEA